jgi:hypothetical protein
VSSDFWRQWQALSTLGPFPWSSGAPFATPGATPGHASPGYASPGASFGASPGFFADSAERFAAAIREFAAAAPGAAPPAGAAPEAAFAAAEGFGNFLREQFAGYFKPPWPSAPGAPAGSAFAQAPPLGLGREQMLRAERAAEAWNRLTEAQGRLHRMWSDTLRDAAAAFTSRLQPAAGEPLTAEAIERLYDLWIECAEEAYGRTAHSDAFCDALSACVNATAQWRRETAAGIEEWAKLWDLPTRSEVNALTLRLRELEAQLAAMSEHPRPARAAPPARDAKPRSAKPRAAPRKRT